MPAKQKLMCRSSAITPVLQLQALILYRMCLIRKGKYIRNYAQTYTGSAITPTPTIKYGDVTLVKDKDYNLTYTDNVNVGKAKINVSFIGNYSGSATTNFDIIPDVLNQKRLIYQK